MTNLRISVDIFENFNLFKVQNTLDKIMQLYTGFGHIRHRTDYYSKKDLGCPKAFLTIVLTYIFLELLWRIPKRAKDNHRLIGWIIDNLGTYLCLRKKILMQKYS